MMQTMWLTTSLWFLVVKCVKWLHKSVDEVLKCDHSNKSYWAVLSCGAVCYAVQGSSNFSVCGWNPKAWPFKWKLLSSTFLLCCSLHCTRWFKLWSLWMKSHIVTIQCAAYYAAQGIFSLWVCWWNPLKCTLPQNILWAKINLWSCLNYILPFSPENCTFIGL